MEAIAFYKKTTGKTLKESKEAIDGMYPRTKKEKKKGRKNTIITVISIVVFLIILSALFPDKAEPVKSSEKINIEKLFITTFDEKYDVVFSLTDTTGYSLDSSWMFSHQYSADLSAYIDEKDIDKMVNYISDKIGNTAIKEAPSALSTFYNWNTDTISYAIEWYHPEPQGGLLTLTFQTLDKTMLKQ